jgi:hypothetical protein
MKKMMMKLGKRRSGLPPCFFETQSDLDFKIHHDDAIMISSYIFSIGDYAHG